MALVDPVREALRARLVDSEELVSLLAPPKGSHPAAIYYLRAPQGAERPYVVIHRASQQHTARDMDGGSARNNVYVVKAVDAGGSAASAETIDAAITDVLDGAELTIEGQESLWLAREAGIEMVEDTDPGQILHVGGEFRLVTAPA